MEHFSSACMTDSFEEFSEVAVPVDGKEIALASDRERYGRDCPRSQGQEVLPLDIYDISERNVQVCSQATG